MFDPVRHIAKHPHTDPFYQRNLRTDPFFQECRAAESAVSEIEQQYDDALRFLDAAKAKAEIMAYLEDLA